MFSFFTDYLCVCRDFVCVCFAFALCLSCIYFCFLDLLVFTCFGVSVSAYDIFLCFLVFFQCVFASCLFAFVFICLSYVDGRSLVPPPPTYLSPWLKLHLHTLSACLPVIVVSRVPI